MLTRGPHKQVILTGAGGWIGRCALDQLAAGDFRVLAVATRHRSISTRSGMRSAVAINDLPSSAALAGTTVIHCGFPTQDQVEILGPGPYRVAVSKLREMVLGVTRDGAPLDLVYLSSGAATSVENGHDVPHRTRIYGQAKLDDEAAYREAIAATGGRLCIVRAFALSGAYMTKPETYALGNMILQALDRGTIEVKATRPVRRSYMAIDDMLRIAMHAVGELNAGESITFETAGEVVEVGELASRVLGVLGCDPEAVTRPPLDPDAPADDYLGDPVLVGELAARAGVVPAGLDEQIAVTAEWLRR